jgi:hypothetical protein
MGPNVEVRGSLSEAQGTPAQLVAVPLDCNVMFHISFSNFEAMTFKATANRHPPRRFRSWGLLVKKGSRHHSAIAASMPAAKCVGAPPGRGPHCLPPLRDDSIMGR